MFSQKVDARLYTCILIGLSSIIPLLSPKNVVKSQETCLQTNSKDGLPFFKGYDGHYIGALGAPDRRIYHENQAIIPSYKFNCCGNVTEWGVDLNPDFRNASFNFIFQVWRPSSSVNTTGCYDLVDDFLSSSISIATQPESKRVARVIPAPQDQLQFQPGDVLGFYVESYGSTDKSDYDNGVVVLNNGSHSSELVWFASVDITAARHSKSGMQSCPYPVGTNGVLSSSTHAAPVISISVVATPCPQMIVTSSLSFALYPTLAVTEHEFEDPLGSSSTNQLVWISVAIVVAAILCTVVAMTVICCIKHHKKGTMPILTDDRDRCEQLHSMETVKLENNQAYGKFSHIHKTDSMENVTYATIESISPSIELKENAAYSMLELRQS